LIQSGGRGLEEGIFAFDLPSEAIAAAVGAVAKHRTLVASVVTMQYDRADLSGIGQSLRDAAKPGQKGQVVASLGAVELARSALESEYRFHQLGSYELGSERRMERLFLVAHPSIPDPDAPREILTSRWSGGGCVGRAQELADLRRLLDNSRLVTVTGPAGIGKSVLIERAVVDLEEEFADGVLSVDLAPIPVGGLLGPALVRLLGAVKLAAEDNLDALVGSLRERRCLLVFDNAEHLLPEVRTIASVLLARCPELQILIGSQRATRVSGEARLKLGGLYSATYAEDWQAIRESDAVALFTDRVQLVDPAFRVTSDNARTIARLCDRLDGIPLAIELAASKTVVLSPRQILDRLDDRFLLLKDSNRAGRHQTLEATLDWGYDHLRPESRVLLRRLSVFSGAFSVDDATAVCVDEALPKELLIPAFEELVDGSMLAPSSLAGTEKRFYLTETVRLYAKSRMRREREEPELVQRHERWCVQLVKQAAKALSSPDQLDWLHRLDAIYEDLRQLIERHTRPRGDLCLATDLLIEVHMYFFMRGYFAEGLSITERVASARGAEKCDAYPRILNMAGVLSSYLDDSRAARDYALRSLRFARKRGDVSQEAAARTSLAITAHVAGQFGRARRHFEFAIDTFRALDDKSRLRRALLNAGGLMVDIGRVEAGERMLLEALELQARDPDPNLRARIFQNLAHVRLAQGRAAEALSLVREAAPFFTESNESMALATSFRNAAHGYFMLGEPRRAALFLGAASRRLKEQDGHFPESARQGAAALRERLVAELGEDETQDQELTGALMQDSALCDILAEI